jgi:hypothetical protein
MASAASSSYVLMGQDSDLQKHVGHQIEVTGTVDNSMSGRTSTSGAAGSTAGGTTAGSTAGGSTSGSTAGGTTAGGSTMAGGGSMSGGQHLRVSSVRMISASCTPSK